MTFCSGRSRLNNTRVHLKQEITKGSPVWITTNGRKIQGQVNANADTPRSYVVITADGGTLRRNSRHLVPTGESVTPTAPEPPQPVQPPSHQMPTRKSRLDQNTNKYKDQSPSQIWGLIREMWHTLTELSVFVVAHALRGPNLSHCIMHSCLVCMRNRLYCHCSLVV